MSSVSSQFVCNFCGQAIPFGSEFVSMPAKRKSARQLYYHVPQPNGVMLKYILLHNVCQIAGRREGNSRQGKPLIINNSGSFAMQMLVLIFAWLFSGSFSLAIVREFPPLLENIYATFFLIILLAVLIGFALWITTVCIFEIWYLNKLGLIDRQRMHLHQSSVLLFLFLIASFLHFLHVGSLQILVGYSIVQATVFTIFAYRFIRSLWR